MITVNNLPKAVESEEATLIILKMPLLPSNSSDLKAYKSSKNYLPPGHLLETRRLLRVRSMQKLQSRNVPCMKDLNCLKHIVFN